LRHTSNNSRAIHVFRFVMSVVICCCMGLPDPENISRCFFNYLVRYFKHSFEHESHAEYSREQREIPISRSLSVFMSYCT
jgi:hypothetical protein